MEPPEHEFRFLFRAIPPLEKINSNTVVVINRQPFD